MKPIEFTVLGSPETQGSMKVFMVKGKPRMTSDNEAMHPWRQQVGWCALEARSKAGHTSLFGKDVALSIQVKFYLKRPKSAPMSRAWPTVKPDVDKLQRAIGDALTGVIYVDDSQVVRWSATKRYGNPPRAEIRIEELA